MISEKKIINREIHGKLGLIELATDVRPMWTHTVRVGKYYQDKWWDRAVQRANEAGCEPALIQKTPEGLWIARTRTQLMPYRAWFSTLRARPR